MGAKDRWAAAARPAWRAVHWLPSGAPQLRPHPTATCLLLALPRRRVRVMMEVLRGIRQIKCYAWEPLFAAKASQRACGDSCAGMCPLASARGYSLSLRLTRTHASRPACRCGRSGARSCRPWQFASTWMRSASISGGLLFWGSDLKVELQQTPQQQRGGCWSIGVSSSEGHSCCIRRGNLPGMAATAHRLAHICPSAPIAGPPQACCLASPRLACML